MIKVKTKIEKKKKRTGEEGRLIHRLSPDSGPVLFQTHLHALSLAIPTSPEHVSLSCEPGDKTEARSRQEHAWGRISNKSCPICSSPCSHHFGQLPPARYFSSESVPLRRKGLPQSLPPAPADLGTELCQWFNTTQMEGSNWLLQHAFWEICR